MNFILVLIISLIVVVLIVITFYTSVNSGAAKFGDWFEKLMDDKPEKKE
jgi:hypothetical protein